MTETVIRVEHLSKQYRLGVINHGRLAKDFQSWWAKMAGKEDPNQQVGLPQVDSMIDTDRFWALLDLSFDVKRGERLGIIGRNGAGKSTFLKILSRVTAPTLGTIRVKGRVASLLEVGTGFNPELTGRENVFLNGAILGMRKVEIKSKFDEIVAFAEVDKFIDTPVKRYSSGMFVRLAFAVAAHLDPDILVVDEVLAVGDVRFQQKCLGKMGEVSAKEGRTVLFVSHNMGAVKNLCSRAILLLDGKIIQDGDTSRVVNEYLGSQDGVLRGSASPGDEVVIEKVVLKDGRGKQILNVNPGSDLSIEIHYRTTRKIRKPLFYISIGSAEGWHFGANMLIDGRCPRSIEGSGTIRCVFHALPLLPKTYSVSLGVRANDGATVLSRTQTVGSFAIVGDLHDFGFRGPNAEQFAEYSAPVVIPYDWHFPDGRRRTLQAFKAATESRVQQEPSWLKIQIHP